MFPLGEQQTSHLPVLVYTSKHRKSPRFSGLDMYLSILFIWFSCIVPGWSTADMPLESRKFQASTPHTTEHDRTCLFDFFRRWFDDSDSHTLGLMTLRVKTDFLLLTVPTDGPVHGPPPFNSVPGAIWWAGYTRNGRRCPGAITELFCDLLSLAVTGTGGLESSSWSFFSAIVRCAYHTVIWKKLQQLKSKTMMSCGCFSQPIPDYEWVSKEIASFASCSCESSSLWYEGKGELLVWTFSPWNWAVGCRLSYLVTFVSIWLFSKEQPLPISWHEYIIWWI